MPVFDPGFFSSMPHGDTEEWAFENFKKKAVAAGGVISDELLAEFRQEVAHGLSQSRDNLEMMAEEVDYI
jgi:hypothetical protein